jgi:hypothetical protein
MKNGLSRMMLLAPVLLALTGRFAEAQFGDWKFDGFPVPSPALSTNGMEGGWYGGDSGYSIALDANTMLWTFADVYIGSKPEPGTRNRARACTGISVGNSIALVKRHPVTKVVTTTHYFRGSPDPNANGVFDRGPYPFFSAPKIPARDQNKSNGDRLWPRKAFLLDGSLYVFAFLVNTEKDVYTFKQTVILKVLNPFDPPSKWEIGLIELGRDTGKQAPAYFGAEAFYVESPDPKQNYLYAYGVYCSDYTRFFSKYQILGVRIPLDQLKGATDGTDLAPVAEVMAKKYDTWKPWPVDPNDFYEIGNSSNFGYQSFTTRFNKTLGAWQATYALDKDLEEVKFNLNNPKGRTVWVAKGAGPFGPWEKPMPAYTFAEAAIPSPTPGLKPVPAGQFPPEPERNRAGQRGGAYHGKLFCYLVREVPALEASDDELALTYSTDTTRVDVDRYWNLDVYTTKLVRSVPNPLLRPLSK